MALCTAEGTDQKILDYFAIPGGAITGYVRITRVDIDYDASNYTALVQAYVSSGARSALPNAGARRYIGGPFEATEIASLSKTDVRDVVYPSIERIVAGQQAEAVSEREA